MRDSFSERVRLETRSDGRPPVAWRPSGVAGGGTACAKALWYGGAGTSEEPKGGLCDVSTESLAGFSNS